MKRLIVVLPLLAAGALAAGCAAEDTGSASASDSSSTSTTAKSKAKTATCNTSKRCDQKIVVRRVKNGQIKLGMSKSQVRAKIGRPSDASNSSMELGDEVLNSSMWTYSPKLADYGDVQTVVLQFSDGILKSKSTV